MVNGTLRINDPERSPLEHFPERFYSWDEFDEYLSEFSALMYQVFRTRTSRTVAAHNKDQLAASLNSKKIFPEEFGSVSKTLRCTHGVTRKTRGEGLRSYTALRCTAGIQATLKFDQLALVNCIAVRVEGAHNHPIGKAQYMAYPENRKITDPALLCVIEVMSDRKKSMKAIIARLTEIVREMTGETFAFLSRDIYNIISRRRKAKQRA